MRGVVSVGGHEAAVEAVRFLKDLGGTWVATDGGKGQKMLAETLFERIEVRSFREFRLQLTDAAIAYGFGAALRARLGISVSGRGERSRPFTIPISVMVASTGSDERWHARSA